VSDDKRPGIVGILSLTCVGVVAAFLVAIALGDQSSATAPATVEMARQQLLVQARETRQTVAVLDSMIYVWAVGIALGIAAGTVVGSAVTLRRWEGNR
jgi:hypothetical protein